MPSAVLVVVIVTAVAVVVGTKVVFVFEEEEEDVRGEGEVSIPPTRELALFLAMLRFGLWQRVEMEVTIKNVGGKTSENCSQTVQ